MSRCSFVNDASTTSSMAASEGCLKRNDSWPGKPLTCGGISAVPSAPRLLRVLLERCALWPRESSGALSTWKSRCCGRRRAVKAQKRQSEGRGVGMPAKWPNAILRGAVLSQRGMVFWTMMHGTGVCGGLEKVEPQWRCPCRGGAGSGTTRAKCRRQPAPPRQAQTQAQERRSEFRARYPDQTPL